MSPLNTVKVAHKISYWRKQRNVNTRAAQLNCTLLNFKDLSRFLARINKQVQSPHFHFINIIVHPVQFNFTWKSEIKKDSQRKLSTSLYDI